MRAQLIAFRDSRRSAVAMIFALSFIPLIYLVGLSVDYTFFSLARSQMQLAAEAAATHAVRAAVSTYTLEKSQGISQANAYADAQEAGTQAGYQWFLAQLGTLPRGTVQYNSSSNPYPNVTITNPNDPGGFYATVSYSGVYPPLFNGMFSRSSQWTYPGDSEAEATFSYAQVLFMLDTSNSMLIGANPSDILMMSDHSVCLLGGVATTAGAALTTSSSNIGTYGDSDMSPYNKFIAYYTGASPNQDTSDVVTFNNGELAYGNGSSANTVSGIGNYFTNGYVMNYNEPSGGPTSTKEGTCDSGASNQTPNAQPPGTSSSLAGVPLTPCALACHTTNIKVTDATSTTTSTLADNPPYSAIVNGQTISYPNGLSYGDSFYMDLYGQARRLRTQQINSGLYSSSVTAANPALALRLDVVFDSVETALTTMNNDEDIPNQFSAGVYQFSQDVSAIATGQATDTLEEASKSLTTVLSSVEADDYLHTPAENVVPQLVTSESAGSSTGFTDFRQSMDDLYYGANSLFGNSSTSLYSEECTQNASEAAILGATLTTTSPGSTGCNLPSQAGTTFGNPQRFLFIVTDGLDDFYNSSGTREGGEMTSAVAESSGTDSTATTLNEDGYTTTRNSYAVCQQFKNLGYTIYVLYVVYYPVPSYYGYYVPGNFSATDYTSNDVSGVTSQEGISTQEATNIYYTNGSKTAELSNPAPDQIGLTACASASTDFFTASDADSIENAMTQMLTSALASTVRLSK